MDIQQQFWMHGLYIAFSSSYTGFLQPSEEALVSCTTIFCNLWMTDVRLQGSNGVDPFFGALQMEQGTAYAEGVYIPYLHFVMSASPPGCLAEDFFLASEARQLLYLFRPLAALLYTSIASSMDFAKHPLVAGIQKSSKPQSRVYK